MEPDYIGLLKDVLFLRTYLMGHMWYMPMIIGMYVALPFVSNAVKNISSKVLAIPFCIVVFLYFIFCLIGVLENSFGFDMELEKKLDTTFLGGVYGVYIIFGLFLQTRRFEKNQNSCCLGCFINRVYLYRFYDMDFKQKRV